jgi:hypothetical protein
MNAKSCVVCGVEIPLWSFDEETGKRRWTRIDTKTCGPTCRKRWQRGTLKRSFKTRPGWGV